MRRWTWLPLVMALACGGSTPPAESPEEPAEASMGDPAAEADAEERSPESDDEAASDSSEASSSGSAASLGDEDVETILQRVIDDEEITGYLRLGEAGRLPLKVKGEVIPSGAKLVKGADVVVVDEVGEGDAVLEFTEISAAGDKVTVRFRFDAEGVKGAVTLTQGLRGWEILRSRITQR